MRNATFAIVAALSLVFTATELTGAQPTPVEKPAAYKATKPFTGRVTRNRVRMRAGADLNSPILRELEQGSLVSVVGEEDTFYAIKPPKEIKAYVYRTYIFDNVVDAANVNVRLEPDLEAPIIAQLNKGDRVEGIVSPMNSRWLEITLPTNVKFYVAKDFVEKAGPEDLAAASNSRKQEAARIVTEAYLASQSELHKAYDQINLYQPLAELNRVMSSYKDVPDQVARAKQYITTIQEEYQQRKSGKAPQVSMPTTGELEPVTETVNTPVGGSGDRMSAWLAKEAVLFNRWLADHPGKNVDDYYAEQRENAVQLRGIIQPYARPVKNKPGNYLLLNHQDNQPVAYLYSTQVDLQENLGKVVTLVAVPRANNNFAFPTFFIMSVEK